MATTTIPTSAATHVHRHGSTPVAPLWRHGAGRGGECYSADIFAVFVLHQNGGQTGQALLAAARAVCGADPSAVNIAFAHLGNLLEDRGTKVDAHVHMIDAGYLALLLALMQPYVALSAPNKKLLAKLFSDRWATPAMGNFPYPLCGLDYAPLPVIGWASVLADSAGGLLIVVLLVEGWGFWNYVRGRRAGPVEPELPKDRTWERRTLLSGGTVLILMGFVFGAWYAGADLYEHEKSRDRNSQRFVDQPAGAGGLADSVNAYGGPASPFAVNRSPLG